MLLYKVWLFWHLSKLIAPEWFVYRRGKTCRSITVYLLTQGRRNMFQLQGVYWEPKHPSWHRMSRPPPTEKKAGLIRYSFFWQICPVYYFTHTSCASKCIVCSRHCRLQNVWIYVMLPSCVWILQLSGMWCDVWCGVMWCGVMMWCGVVRCVVWCDVEWWCDVMWCDVVWCNVWCDVMWCDVMWCDVMWCDVWYGVMWCGVMIWCVV